jgi:hypothetical protein
MATYFLEFSDQNYDEICYSIRKVPMGQSKFTAQSFQKTATFGLYASAFMVKMDHQNGPQIEIDKMKYNAFKSAPFETLNEPNKKK